MARVKRYTVEWRENDNPKRVYKKTFAKEPDAERFRRNKGADPKVVPGSATMLSSAPRFPRR